MFMCYQILKFLFSLAESEKKKNYKLKTKIFYYKNRACTCITTRRLIQ